jgi:Na+-driven multidrug efflux pump
MCSVMTIACSIIYMLFGRTFLSLFTTDDEVLDAGMMILRTIAPTFITYISIEILSGTIRGCGVSIIPTLFITIGICVFRILWVIFIFPLRPDVQNIMSTYPFSWILTSTMFLLYYRFGHWLHETHV